MRDAARLGATVASLKTLLDSHSVTERAIVDFIRNQQAYFAVASLLKAYFSFGHHEAHLFPEFPLGTSYRVDYLLAGDSSDGWHLVFVELESPQGSITTASGDLGGVFRKGLGQIADWDAWLESHFGSLAEVFDKVRNRTKELPREFRLLDKSRLHYVVVAGRRADFTEKTYRTRRTNAGAKLILHYDNLVDAANAVIGRPTY